MQKDLIKSVLIFMQEELINEIETLTQKVKFQLSQGFPQANASSSVCICVFLRLFKMFMLLFISKFLKSF